MADRKSRSVILTESINKLLHRQSLNEASLTRIWQHLNSNRSFVMLTAFRGEYSLQQNRERNKEMIAKIKSYGYGYFSIEGHYPEIPEGGLSASDDETPVSSGMQSTFRSGDLARMKQLDNSDPFEGYNDAVEESVFVINTDTKTKESEKVFRERMTELGAKYGQDSIFYKSPKGSCYFLYTRDAGGYHKWQRQRIPGDVLTNPKSYNHFFSSVKGKNFSFNVG